MTLELYPASAHNAFHGTGLHFPQCVDEAVQQIHGACQGLGTDEKTLITVLGSKSPETRNLIALRYKELYHKPLKDLVKSETSGDFGRLLRMISTPLSETEAQILRDATKGMGTTESLIIQILSGRSNEEMNILKRTYFDLVGKDLAVTMNSELSGDFRKVVMAVLQSPQVLYNPAVHNAAKAEEEATALYKAGQGRLGTNEEAFIGILVKAPPELLKMMDAVYVAKYNNNIAKAVDKEFSGDAKKSLNYLVRSIMDPYPAIAEVFEKTMKGFGTDETGLSTALVRYQSVLPYVKAAYKKLYREELRDRISGETSGDYKSLLMEVFDAPQDPPKTKGVKGAHGAVASSGDSTLTVSRLKRHQVKQRMAPLQARRRHRSLQDIRRSMEAVTPANRQLKRRARDQSILLRSNRLGTRPSRNSNNKVILVLSSRLATRLNNSSSSKDILRLSSQPDIRPNNNNKDILLSSSIPNTSSSSRITLHSPDTQCHSNSNLGTHRNSSPVIPHSSHNQGTHRINSQIILPSLVIRRNSNRATHLSNLVIRHNNRTIRSSSLVIHHSSNRATRRTVIHPSSQGILHNSQDTLRSNTHLLDSLSRTEVHLRLKVAILRLVAISISILPPVDTLRTECFDPSDLPRKGNNVQYI
ncbi:hypothetical protein BBI17_003912 [Phytophthora kernoviae]|uniref:Annexin n=2 Tax=Phytophthora kernoviae TaxID=325452 RepID=A0A3R7IJG9_9STRA|nr:hypothetical protein G195_006494 [Phytophthora kernoviae 00238/432]KAG2522953.1 hypothetical protein JM16_004575 [Phytophthora kernoviae]KAG2524605.1 hypothetical protein JM18_004101 [Phytophthora kernoviae]RLN25729.1 hypothetical protein BBI17_003912 [Phytophthora kernoviae]